MKKPIKINIEKNSHSAPSGTGNAFTVIDEAFKGILFAPVGTGRPISENELNRIIIYDNTIYILSDKQFESLIEVQEEAKNLPFAGDLHIEEHLNFNIDQYKCIGEIDFDFDQPK